MQRSFKYIISFIIIFSLCIVLPFSSLAVDSFSLNTNLVQIMGVRNFYYAFHSYSYESSANEGPILFAGHVGYYSPAHIYELDPYSTDNGYSQLFGNESNGIILTRWSSIGYQSYIEYCIPLSFGRFSNRSPDFGFSAQFGFSISAEGNLYSPDLVESFDIDKIYFKGQRRIDSDLFANYEYLVNYNELPVLVTDTDNYYYRLLNMSFSYSSDMFEYLTDYIDMDYLYIRVRKDMRNSSVFSGVTTHYGFTRLDINSTETDYINIIGNLNNLQLKIDTLIAAVNNNFSALFELLENADTSEQLQIIQQTIQEVNGEWSEADEELYEAYVEETKQTTDRMEQMGDILNSVPKPPTQNITQVIKPSDTLVDTDIDGALTALNVIYNWKTFGTIIALVVALMTISYVIFGKKK